MKTVIYNAQALSYDPCKIFPSFLGLCFQVLRSFHLIINQYKIKYRVLLTVACLVACTSSSDFFLRSCFSDESS